MNANPAPRPRALGAVERGAYQLAQAVLAALLRRQNQRNFDGVEHFCLFVGYPRSGHTLVGAMLDAHPDAVIAHELDAPAVVLAGASRNQLYGRILARAWWFARRGSRSNYNYQIRGQWQGRWRRLQVLGDKRGGAVTRCLATHPAFLSDLRRLVGVPLRLIHVVRNPFDTIAAISIWHGMSLEVSCAYYFELAATTRRLAELCPPDCGEVLTVHHEALVANPIATLNELTGFLGLIPDPSHLEACREIVFAKPTGTARRVAWPDGLIDEIAHQQQKFSFLEGYRKPEG